MKQRIVIEVSTADIKYPSKVMKIAAVIEGVESVAITGPEKNRVEVVGDGVDAAALTKLIRKKVGHAEIVSVGEVEQEKAAAANPPQTATPAPPEVVWPVESAPIYIYGRYWDYPRPGDMREDPSCSMM